MCLHPEIVLAVPALDRRCRWYGCPAAAERHAGFCTTHLIQLEGDNDLGRSAA